MRLALLPTKHAKIHLHFSTRCDPSLPNGFAGGWAISTQGAVNMTTDSKLIVQQSTLGDITEARSIDCPVTLSLDAFVRSIGVRRAAPLAIFLGAGTSTSSGVPSAQMCVWEWKRQIFLTNNPGLEEQFAELSLDGVRRRIQRWLDRQGGYPTENATEEYGFYIHKCFPIADDRRRYFAELVREARPHIGYRLLCHLAEADLIRSVWSPNFDHMTARAAANFKLHPVEAGIDTQHRAARSPAKGELLCVSMHGDYRYDKLKNTPAELQEQEAALQAALVNEVRDTSLVVAGYSGRDESLMNTLKTAYGQPGNGILYWCGFGDSDPPLHVLALIEHARGHHRQAYYVPTLGFDDLLTRVSLHCLQGDGRKAAFKAMEEFAPEDKLVREPWQVAKYHSTTLIKSNSFAIECPSEIFRFDLQQWPEERVWSCVRQCTDGHALVAVPFKGKLFALGSIDTIKEAFGDNIKGPIERTPVGPKDLLYDDGAIVALMREALTRSMAESANLRTDGRHELWNTAPREDQRQCKAGYVAYESLHLYLRRLGGTQYLVLMPSIKVLDRAGAPAPLEIANPVKLAILGYQHNKPFNRAIMNWRSVLFPKDAEAVYEYPHACGSSFRFKIRRSPVFGEIGLPQGGKVTAIPPSLQPLIKYSGLQLTEPELVFSNKAGTGLVRSPHPIRGIVDNRPFDYPLTTRGFFTGLRLAVICPEREAKALYGYLQNVNHTLTPAPNERDYLVDFPGFQSAYGVPIELPQPGERGWFFCPEPTSSDPHTNALELAGHINRGVEMLQSSHAPHVVMVLYPSRWRDYRGYRTEAERFERTRFRKGILRPAWHCKPIPR